MLSLLPQNHFVSVGVETCRIIGSELGIDPYDVLPLSTGVIGRPLPMDKISAGLRGIFAELKPNNLALAAQPIQFDRIGNPHAGRVDQELHRSMPRFHLTNEHANGASDYAF